MSAKKLRDTIKKFEARKFVAPFKGSDPQKEWDDAQKSPPKRILKPMNFFSDKRRDQIDNELRQTAKELEADQRRARELKHINSLSSQRHTLTGMEFSPDESVYTGDQVHPSFHNDEADHEINQRMERARRHIKGQGSESEI